MTIEILPYAPQHAPHFKRLNWEWIEQYFSIEPSDELLLGQPETYIIQPGGEIWLPRRPVTASKQAPPPLLMGSVATLLSSPPATAATEIQQPLGADAGMVRLI